MDEGETLRSKGRLGKHFSVLPSSSADPDIPLGHLLTCSIFLSQIPVQKTAANPTWQSCINPCRGPKYTTRNDIMLCVVNSDVLKGPEDGAKVP